MRGRILAGTLAVVLAGLSGACSDEKPTTIADPTTSADADDSAEGGKGLTGADATSSAGDVDPVDVAALEAKAEAAAGQVVARSRAFEPATVTIKAGEAVAWRFEDGQVPHGVVGDGFDTPPRNQGVFVHTFADAGSYAYRCPIHPAEMQGTVEVR